MGYITAASAFSSARMEIEHFKCCISFLILEAGGSLDKHKHSDATLNILYPHFWRGALQNGQNCRDSTAIGRNLISRLVPSIRFRSHQSCMVMNCTCDMKGGINSSSFPKYHFSRRPKYLPAVPGIMEKNLNSLFGAKNGSVFLLCVFTCLKDQKCCTILWGQCFDTLFHWGIIVMLFSTLFLTSNWLSMNPRGHLPNLWFSHPTSSLHIVIMIGILLLYKALFHMGYLLWGISSGF